MATLAAGKYAILPATGPLPPPWLDFFGSSFEPKGDLVTKRSEFGDCRLASLAASVASQLARCGILLHPLSCRNQAIVFVHRTNHLHSQRQTPGGTSGRISDAWNSEQGPYSVENRVAGERQPFGGGAGAARGQQHV